MSMFVSMRLFLCLMGLLWVVPWSTAEVFPFDREATNTAPSDFISFLTKADSLVLFDDFSVKILP
jgi:hypothetical protein